MRGKRLPGIAAIGLIMTVVAGCGGTAVVLSRASSPAPVTTVADKTVSARYCQERVDDGDWVTNEAESTTPCVPDPSYATGDEQADASIAIPRCFSCKLSDWDRAEQRAAKRRQSPPMASHAATTATGSTGVDGWSSSVRQNFLSVCSGALCECLANHLQWQVPAAQAQTLSADDPRVQTAARDCQT